MNDNDDVAYWLNEAQTLLLCMRGDTAECAAVRAEIIAVFQAATTGGRIPPTPHWDKIAPHWDKIAVMYRGPAPQ
jgi:hypothetical protein